MGKRKNTEMGRNERWKRYTIRDRKTREPLDIKKRDKQEEAKEIWGENKRGIRKDG